MVVVTATNGIEKSTGEPNPNAQMSNAEENLHFQARPL